MLFILHFDWGLHVYYGIVFLLFGLTILLIKFWERGLNKEKDVYRFQCAHRNRFLILYFALLMLDPLILYLGFLICYFLGSTMSGGAQALGMLGSMLMYFISPLGFLIICLALLCYGFAVLGLVFLPLSIGLLAIPVLLFMEVSAYEPLFPLLAQYLGSGALTFLSFLYFYVLFIVILYKLQNRINAEVRKS